MGRRQDWQRARREALDGQSRWRAERAAKDDRCADLGVAVVVALRERAAAVTECEARAGEALRALVEDEGLSASEAVRWCAGAVTVAEAGRLRRLAVKPEGAVATGGDAAAVEDDAAPR